MGNETANNIANKKLAFVLRSNTDNTSGTDSFFLQTTYSRLR